MDDDSRAALQALQAARQAEGTGLEVLAEIVHTLSE